MAFNPYTPPTEAYGPSAGGQPGGTAGGPLAWEPGDTMGRAWEIFKAQWATLVFAPILAGIPAAIVNQIGQRFMVDQREIERLSRRGDSPEAILNTLFANAAPAFVVITVLGIFIGAFFRVGLVRIFLQAARGQYCQFGELLQGGPRFLAMAGALLLKSLVIGIGLLLFIVPGCIAAAGLVLTEFYVVDQNMGPIEAMKASWAATEGQRGKIVLLYIIGIGVAILGMLACCIGLFAAAPTIEVAWALSYVAMSGAIGQQAFAGYGGGGGFGPPGGGYGPPGGGYGPPGGGYGGGGGGYGPPGGGYGPR